MDTITVHSITRVMTERIDIDLVPLQKIRAGDKNAFKEIYERYEKSTFILIKSIVGNTLDAEDLTIETFMKAYKKIGTFIPNFLFRTWLNKIAKNTALDFLEYRKHRIIIKDTDILISQIESKQATQLQIMVSDETVILIKRSIRKLQPNYREAIIRQVREFGNQTNTLRSHLFKARKHLKKLIS